MAYCLCSAVRSLSGQLAPPPPPLAVPTPQLQGSADAAAANAGGALAATASSGPPQLSGPGSSKSVDLSPGSGGGGGGAIGGGLLSGCIERKLLWELVATWCQDGKAPGGCGSLACLMGDRHDRASRSSGFAAFATDPKLPTAANALLLLCDLAALSPPLTPPCRPIPRTAEASEYASRLAAGMSQALGRLRDLDAEGREAVRVELLQCAEALDAAARGAMAALLQVGEARRLAPPRMMRLRCYYMTMHT